MLQRQLLLVLPEIPVFEHLISSLGAKHQITVLRPEQLDNGNITPVTADAVIADLDSVPAEIRGLLLDEWLDKAALPVIDLSRVRDPGCVSPDERALIPKPPYCITMLPVLLEETIQEALLDSDDPDILLNKAVRELLNIFVFSVSGSGYSCVFEAMQILCSNGCTDSNDFNRSVVVPVAKNLSLSTQCVRKRLNISSANAWLSCNDRLRTLLHSGSAAAEDEQPSCKDMLFAAADQFSSGCLQRRWQFLLGLKNEKVPY